MNSQSAAQSESEFAAFIGIDWADTKHDICLQAADSTLREFAVLPHRPADIDDWVTSLRQRFHGKPVAICIETSRGALVYALQKYDFLVLFPINPATLAKYRQAFKPSRAKADPTDAQIALEILMSHRDKLKPLRPQSPAIRALTLLLEERRQIVVRHWLRACWSPSANNATATQALPRFRCMPASLRSQSAAASNTGCTGECNAPRSCARRLSSGRH